MDVTTITRYGIEILQISNNFGVAIVLSYIFNNHLSSSMHQINVVYSKCVDI